MNANLQINFRSGQMADFFRRLAPDVFRTGKALDDVQRKSDRAAASTTKYARSAQAASSGTGLLGRAVGALGRGFQELYQKSSMAFKAMQGGGSALSGFKGLLGAVGRDLLLVGAGMLTLQSGLALLHRSTSENLAFGKSLTQITTLAKVSRAEVGAWSAQIKDLSRETGRGPQELAEGMLAITSAGVRGTEAMDVLQASAKGAAIGLGTTRDIAVVGSAAMLAYGADSLSASKAIDVLLSTVQEGAAEAAELAPALGRVIGVAATLGVEMSDVGAYVATLTRLGVPAAEAVTSLRSVLQAILNPTTQATKALDDIGYSMEKLKADIADKGLAPALVNLVDLFGDNTAGLADFVGQMEGLSGLLGTAGQQAEDYVKVQEAVRSATGEINRMFAEAAADPAVKAERMAAAFAIMRVELGDRLVPVLLQVGTAFLAVLERNPDLLDNLGKIAAVVANIVGTTLSQAFALFTDHAGKVAIALAGIAALNAPVVFAAIATAATATSGALASMGAAATLALGPWGVAILALTAVVIEAEGAIDRWGESSQRQIELMVNQTAAARDLGTAIRDAATAGNEAALKAAIEQAKAGVAEAQARFDELEAAAERIRTLRPFEAFRSEAEVSALGNINTDQQRAQQDLLLMQRRAAEAQAALDALAKAGKKANDNAPTGPTAEELAARKAQADRINTVTKGLAEQLIQEQMLTAATIQGGAALDAVARTLEMRNAAIQAGLDPTSQAAQGIMATAGALHDQKKATEEASQATEDALEIQEQFNKILEDQQTELTAYSLGIQEAMDAARAAYEEKLEASNAELAALAGEADYLEGLNAARQQGKDALREYMIAQQAMIAVQRSGLSGADAELLRLRTIAELRRLAAAEDMGQQLDANEQAVAASAQRIQGIATNMGDQVASLGAKALTDMIFTGEANWEDLFLSMIDIARQAFEQLLKEWLLNLAKMEAAELAVNGGGGGGGGGMGSVAGMGQGASAAGMSGSTIAVLGVFAAVAYSWYNDRQHEYERIETAIRDIEQVFASLSETLGQYLPAFAASIDVRKDGDRFRSKVGFDDGSAGYQYFDDYADAVGAAVLSSLREMLNEGSVFGEGRLGHLGEEAKKVIGSITDAIIEMGQAGVEWVERGLALAGRLDNLGKSEMQIALGDLDREYQENIRLAQEYGLSLEKVAELYRRSVADLEASVRSRIAQYLPGYDPVGEEFDRIRSDNAAIQAEYARMREAINAQIAIIMTSIETLTSGGGGGGTAGGVSQLMQYFEDLARLMGSEVSISSGWGGGENGRAIVETYEDLLAELDRFNDVVATGGSGIAPDVAERIAAQRKMLEDLMRQLSLIPAGISEEEIAAAEREARRRNRRGSGRNRAQEIEQFTDQLGDIVRGGLPDFVAGLLNLEDQITDINTEVARLGIDSGLAAEAIATLNRQIGEQAREAFLSLAERMAEMVGDEETLRDLAQLRWEIERDNLGLQIELLAESGRLSTEQVDRLRLLWSNLPITAPDEGPAAGNTEPTGPGASQIFQGFGVDIQGALDQVTQMADLAFILDSIANSTKVAIPGLSELQAEIAGLSEEARATVSQGLFVGFGDQLMGFVDRYYGEVEGFEDFRLQLEQARFAMEIANLRVQFEILKGLNVLSAEAVAQIGGVLAWIDANPPDWDAIMGGGASAGGRGGGSGSGGVDITALRDGVLDMLESWRRAKLGPAATEAMRLAESLKQVQHDARAAGVALGTVMEAYGHALDAFVDNALRPFEDLNLSPLERELRDIQGQFVDLLVAFEIAGASAEDMARLQKSFALAMEDFMERATQGIRDLLDDMRNEDPRRTSQQAFLEAQSEYRSLLERAQGGDLEAIEQLAAAASLYREQAMMYLGGGVGLEQILDQIMAGLEGIVDGDVIPEDIRLLQEQADALRQLVTISEAQPTQDSTQASWSVVQQGIDYVIERLTLMLTQDTLTGAQLLAMANTLTTMLEQDDLSETQQQQVIDLLTQIVTVENAVAGNTAAVMAAISGLLTVSDSLSLPQLNAMSAVVEAMLNMDTISTAQRDALELMLAELNEIRGLLSTPTPPGVPEMRTGGRVGDEGLFYLHSGELVLSPEQTTAFDKMFDRSGNPIRVPKELADVAARSARPMAVAAKASSSASAAWAPGRSGQTNDLPTAPGTSRDVVAAAESASMDAVRFAIETSDRRRRADQRTIAKLQATQVNQGAAELAIQQKLVAEIAALRQDMGKSRTVVGKSR